jgi:signal peptidase I
MESLDKWVLIAVAGLVLLRRMVHTPSRRNTDLSAFRDLLDAVLTAVVIVFLIINPLLYRAYFIPSESMNPTLTESDRILVNKLVYRFRAPGRGDIVVFRPPVGKIPESKDYIKRVVALAGETLEVVPKRLMVDSKTLLRLTSHSASQMMSDNFDPTRSIGFTYPLNGGTTYLEEEGTAIITNGRQFELRVATYRRGDRIRRTPNEVTVNGKAVLSVVFGPIVVGSRDLTRWGGDPRVRGTLYNVNGTPRLMLVEGSDLHFDPGHLIVNGRRLEEPFVAEGPLYAFPPTKVPPGHVFVLGDNRNYSFDSHAWGPLPLAWISGRADVLFWPTRRARFIPAH